jgi:hypothetical protein
MEALKIVLPSAESKPCVCGATLFRTNVTRPKAEPIWLCSRHCGAYGLTYESALRRKVRLDLLSWSNLRRHAQTLIAADEESDDENSPQYHDSARCTGLRHFGKRQSF